MLIAGLYRLALLLGLLAIKVKGLSLAKREKLQNEGWTCKARGSAPPQDDLTQTFFFATLWQLQPFSRALYCLLQPVQHSFI